MAQQRKIDLAIIIPAHNEEKRILSTLESYSSFFGKLINKGLKSYILFIVINNTQDKTEEVVREYAKKNKRVSYIVLKKGGKGYAIIEGFKFLLEENYNYMGFVDADGATPPEAFYDLLKNSANCDGAIASRWLPNSIIKTPQTLLRKITSRGFNFLVRVMFLMPYADTQCGAKIFSKKVIKSIINKVGITRWAFDVDLLYRIKRQGFKIKEVPTTWSDKSGTRLNLVKVPFEMFSGILRLRLINSPFNFIVRAYDILPSQIKIHEYIK